MTSTVWVDGCVGSSITGKSSPAATVLVVACWATALAGWGAVALDGCWAAAVAVG
jgi:hypothetical protein